jgi:Cu/Ag efflux pump CusA
LAVLFADGPGAEIQVSLAIVVMGELVTATALTLMLLRGSWTSAYWRKVGDAAN